MSHLPRLVLALSLLCSAAAVPLVAQTTAPAAPAPALQADPQHQAYSLPAEKLAKAIALNRIQLLTGIADALWGLVVMLLLLFTKTLARIEQWASRILPRRWLAGLLFFALYFLISTLIGLPISVYAHHVQRAYGISVQGWASWAGDQGKALGLTLLLGAPLLLLFNWIVRRWTRRYWLGLWIVTLPILVLSIFVSPLIEPLFNQYEPLSKSNPALVTELQKVVARTGTNIPPERMFLMKASLKSNGLNAYVSGIGATKRVVVWDTTAGRIPTDEVLFIFGHESGHYVLQHIPKSLAVSALFLFFLYWACAAFTAGMVRRFGTAWGIAAEVGVASRTGLTVLLLALSIAGFLVQPASAAFSRYHEHEADVYGQEAVHGLVADPQQTAVASFNALGEAWLEDPNPHPFVEFWTFTHPSVQNRANFALHYNPWANGGHGRFFAQ